MFNYCLNFHSCIRMPFHGVFSLEELPVCVLSTVAGFLDQTEFSEFVSLSASFHSCALLPSSVMLGSSQFHNFVVWYSEQVHLLFIFF